MSRLNELKKHLKTGRVYRRDDLAKWSRSVDRHLRELLDEGTIQKLSQGLYYLPKTSAFGKTPPPEHELIRSFLKDDRFLLTTPNAYNNLGVGTTQLYNKMVVYNHKRHGDFKLGNRKFTFQVKHNFPAKLTEEFLLIDLLNNLDKLAEDKDLVLKNLKVKALSMNRKRLQQTVSLYGASNAKKLLEPMLNEE